jgi:hypothetical protein
MIVNKVTFADMAGVGKASVTLSVQRGKLVETADGYIDTESPVNAAYLAKRKAGAAKESTPNQKPANKTTAKKRERKPRKEVTTKLDGLDGVELPDPDLDVPDDGDEGGVDQLSKLAVDIRLKRAQARRHELKFEQDKGSLIPVESVERAAAKVGAEIKIRLQDLPRRITPRIMAMARSGADDKEVQAALEREIDDGIDAVRSALGATIA